MSRQDASEMAARRYIREREKEQRTVNKERRAKPSAKCAAAAISLAPAIAGKGVPGEYKFFFSFFGLFISFAAIT